MNTVNTSKVPAFAPSQGKLATLLGVSRQLIAYHCKQSGSPGRSQDGRYPVEKWREYLTAVGRTTLKDPRRCFGSNLIRNVAEHSARYHLECAGSVLPDVVKTESGLSEAKAAELAVMIWVALVCRFTAAMKADTFNKDGYYDGLWSALGFGDVSKPPASVPLYTPEEIKRAAKLAGIPVPDGIDLATEEKS